MSNDKYVPYQPPGASDRFEKRFVQRTGDGRIYYAEETAANGSAVYLASGSVSVDDGGGSLTVDTGTGYLYVSGTVTMSPTYMDVTGSVGGFATLVDVALTLTTGTYYYTGDVFDDCIPLANAMRIVGGTGVLGSVFIFNEDDTADLAVDLLFFSSSGTIGTQDAAPTVTDVYARELIGYISFAAADFVDLGGVKIAYKYPSSLGAVVKATADRSLWMASIYKGTSGTYTANGVRARVGFLQD